jgi:hypothetical protein
MIAAALLSPVLPCFRSIGMAVTCAMAAPERAGQDD